MYVIIHTFIGFMSKKKVLSIGHKKKEIHETIEYIEKK